MMPATRVSLIRMRGPTGVLPAAVLLLVVFLAAGHGGATPRGRTTAADAERNVLEREASASWEQERVGLRTALKRLADANAVHLFLDRRINPDAPLAGNFPLQSLRTLIGAVGRENGFGVTSIESLMYLGPPESTRRLRTIDLLRRKEAEALGPGIANSLFAREPLAWPDLATPHDLVVRVCRRAGLKVANVDLVPHDLWAAHELPELPRVTQLTVLLAGFDLTFTCDRQRLLTLRPIRNDELWDETHRLLPRTGVSVEQLRREFPDATIEVASTGVRVLGLIEDHEAIGTWLQTGKRPRQPNAQTRDPAVENRRFDVRVVRKPLRDVLRHIEQQTDFRITFESAGDERLLDRLVTFEVNQVDIDGLLEAALKPIGMSFSRDGNQIVISAGGRP